MHPSVRYFLLLCVLMDLATSAHAGGFQIGEMATRASGMGSAFTAVADDASAAWYNPAGVGFTRGGRVLLGSDALIVPGATYVPNAYSKGAGGVPVTASTTAKAKTLFVPHAYYTYIDATSRLGMAIGVNSPFGLVTDWPANGPFASKNTYSRIRMWMVNPSVVYQLSDHLSLAAGADYAYLANVDLNNTNQTLSGHGDGWGGNAALLYRSGGFSAGISYRSRIRVDIRGSAVAQSSLRTVGGTSTSATSSVTLPDQVNIGLAYRLDKDWLLSLDVDWVNWKTYDAIRIAYGSAAYRTAVATLQAAVGATATGSTNEPMDWKATTAVRLGVEWTCQPDMHIRFGYVFDPTPSSDVYFSPSTPDSDRQIFSIGYGYDIDSHTTLDLMYGYVYFMKRHQIASPATPPKSPDSVKNGDYRSQVHILSVSLRYRF